MKRGRRVLNDFHSPLTYLPSSHPPPPPFMCFRRSCNLQQRTAVTRTQTFGPVVYLEIPIEQGDAMQASASLLDDLADTQEVRQGSRLLNLLYRLHVAFIARVAAAHSPPASSRAKKANNSTLLHQHGASWRVVLSHSHLAGQRPRLLTHPSFPVSFYRPNTSHN